MNGTENSFETIKVLVVDDEKAARYGIVKALRPEGYRVSEAEDGVSALTMVNSHSYDVIITDVSMPGMSGIDLLRKMKEQNLSGFVIVITAHGSEKLAVEAMKSGAFDYLSKPFEIDELRAIVGHAAKQILLVRENERLKTELETSRGFGNFIGESTAMKAVYSVVEKVSKNNVTVLIRGESGTGKELVARTIHDLSSRKSGPFISINCAAIPKELIESELFGHEKGAFTGAIAAKPGKFELANNGTIFLDEIGDMSIDTQAKVLRVLQERKFERVGGSESIEVNVRILSATHRDLQKEIREGRFREDLFYRINVVEIELPALRKRDGDVPLLAKYYLNSFAKRHNIGVSRFSPEVLKIFMDYEWPGNVRELINIIERCVVLSSGEEITKDLLPPDLIKTNGLGPIGVKAVLDNADVTFQEAKQRVVRAFEREFLLEAIKLNDWNISQTATKLGMKRQYLQQKLKELEINLQEIKEDS
ncbi:sigma-54 dependent transcriptional regulator [bacterium]|nr:sigma-54 dependent transcriptional regulator [bacterium]